METEKRLKYKEGLIEGFLKAFVVLVPTYVTAYTTDKMVYVIPMLAAASFVAASMFKENTQRRVDQDVKDVGKSKDDASS